MKLALIVFGLFLQLPFASAQEAFPKSPDPSLTPGSLCESRGQIRYPEKIPYCPRNVESSLKKEIIRTYDVVLGFKISQMDRQLFKIDHYIPLCMGGSNDEKNLWPQHQMVFQITDPLEQVSCEKMALGKLRQSEAIQIIKEAKEDLSRAAQLLQYVRNKN